MESENSKPWMESNLTTRKKVEALFARTETLFQAAVPVRNVIINQLDRNELEDALAATYYRMCFMVESLIRLNELPDFQVSLHCARCLYELYFDVADLVRDPSLVAKFNAFTFVARFDAAQKFVNELQSQGIADANIGRREREHVNDSTCQAKFQSDLSTHWPSMKKAPSNWTGLTLPQRAKQIGGDELIRYRESYSLFCWYSHAGVVGVSGLSTNALESAMGIAHGYSQDSFLKATNLIARHFGIYEAYPAIKSVIDAFEVAAINR